MPQPNYFFYDLETSGFNPKTARIMQFAGQRTDMELKLLGKPCNYLIKMNQDVLPDPEAVLVTGLTPQRTLTYGITEAALLKIFYEKIYKPGTIFVGFNSIRFDDEFMRYLHYRNFYDPYEWHWKDSCTRWDLLDLVRITRALRPEGIKWPVDSMGRPSNKLKLLTGVNNLMHDEAHEAMSDVLATIALAKLIKEKQPKLFEFMLTMRKKDAVSKLVNSGQPFIYTSGKYDSQFEKTTLVSKLADHPSRPGSVLVYDLRHDPSVFLDMEAADLAEAWKWQKDQQSLRLPVKVLQFNRCPAIAPSSVLDANGTKRLGLDPQQVKQNQKRLLSSQERFVKALYGAIELLDKKRQTRLLEDETDVDGRLYDGFFNNKDKSSMRAVRQADVKELKKINPVFSDERLQKLFLLYKARNFPGAMNEQEKKAWHQFRTQKLLSGEQDSALALYFRKIDELSEIRGMTTRQKHLLEDLKQYGEAITPNVLLTIV